MLKQSANLKPGWRRVKCGDVVRLSKALSQDPLVDGFERYVGLEHLEPAICAFAVGATSLTA